MASLPSCRISRADVARSCAAASVPRQLALVELLDLEAVPARDEDQVRVAFQRDEIRSVERDHHPGLVAVGVDAERGEDLAECNGHGVARFQKTRACHGGGSPRSGTAPALRSPAGCVERNKELLRTNGPSCHGTPGSGPRDPARGRAAGHGKTNNNLNDQLEGGGVRQSAESPTIDSEEPIRLAGDSFPLPSEGLTRSNSEGRRIESTGSRPDALEVVAWKARVFRSQEWTISFKVAHQGIGYESISRFQNKRRPDTQLRIRGLLPRESSRF